METQKYKLTVGLEIHAELKTKTKMFCHSANDPDEKRPNVNICPTCMGHPGTLPTINREAVRSVLRVGLALGGRLADFTEFDRKNYFYPDIPKGYQISQYQYPLVSGGELAGVAITRVHLEEDTARSQHDNETGESLVDYNRAGVPLLELVTEPVITSAKQAGDFARSLKLLLGPEYLAVSEANLEKGEMRVEANISVSVDDKLGGKVEVKNLNSFRAVEKAIEYEYERQVGLREKGETVAQETRGWNETKQETFSQRKKEFSHDYRYFPDPDLPKLYLSQIADWQALDRTLPELPDQKTDRFRTAYGIKDDDIKVFVASGRLSELFEEVASRLTDRSKWQTAANYLVSDLAGLLSSTDTNHLPTADHFAELINLLADNQISSRGAKDILALMVETGQAPSVIADQRGLRQKSGQADLEPIVDEVIAANPEVVADFRSGNDKVLQFLIGQGMKASRGSANPEVLAELLVKKLGRPTSE